MEAWERRLQSVTGTEQRAAEEIGYLRSEAERLGVEFGVAADEFTRFYAATRGTALAPQTREIYSSLLEGVAVMRLTAHETTGVMTALTQIVSKNVVSAEELRQQLGDRLPGAFQIAAEGLGLTTEELNKQLAAGTILAEDFLPKFAAAMRQRFGKDVPDAANSAQAAFNRLKTAILEIGVAAAESGLLEYLAGAAEFVSDLANPNLPRDPLGPALRAVGAVSFGGVEVPTTGTIPERIAAVEAQRNPAGSRPAQAQNQVVDRVLAKINLLLDEAAATALVRARTSEALERLTGATGRERRAAEAAYAAAQRAERDVADHFDPITAIIESGTGASLRGSASRVHAPRVRDAEPPPPEAGAKLVEALRRRVEATQQLTHVQRLLNRIDREGIETNAAQRTAAISLATLLDENEARKKAEAAADKTRAEQQAAAAKALAEYGGATRDLTEAEKAAQLVAKAGSALKEHQIVLINQTAEAKDAERKATERQTAAEARRRAEEEAAAAAERALRESTKAVDGATRALADYAEFASDAAGNVEEALVGAFRGAEDALTRFVLTGKASFSDFVDSLLRDLARLVIRQAILAPIANALGQRLAGGTAAGTTVDLEQLFPDAPTAPVPGFGAARRPGFAGGAGASATGPPVTIEVHNEGQPLSLRETGRDFDGARWVIGVVAEDVGSNGALARMLGSTYGLQPRPT